MTHKLNSLFKFSNYVLSKNPHVFLKYFSDYSGINKIQLRATAVGKNNPDVFGTLSSSVPTITIPSLDDEKLEEGDLEEHEKISFIPNDVKSSQEFSDNILQLVKNKKLKEALKLLEVEMKQDQVKPTKSIYSILIGACGRAGYTKKAFSLYNNMKKRGMDTNESIYTALFNSCANSPWKEDGLSRAVKLKEQLKNKSYISNRQQYHAMLKAFGRCGDLQTVYEILEEMSSNQLPPSSETFNFLLQACSSLPNDGFCHGITVWRKMRSVGIVPDQFSYNLMLRIARDCGIGSNQEQSLEDMQKLIEGKSPPNNQEHNLIPLDESSIILPNLLSPQIQSRNVTALQNMHLPGNRLALLGNTDGFLDLMKKDKVKPNIKTYTLLLETMADDLIKEEELLNKMKKSGILPDIGFFNLLIRKRQIRRDYSQGKRVLGYLQEYKVHPNIMTFGVLAMGCRNFKEAESLISSMEDAGFRVNIEIFGSLLRNAVFKRNCWYIIELMNRAVELQLTLDDKSIQLLKKFKDETTDKIACHERGEKVDAPYGRKIFKKEFRVFCLQYKSWLAKLYVDPSPHPWQQYRYEIDKPRKEAAESKSIE